MKNQVIKISIALSLFYNWSVVKAAVDLKPPKDLDSIIISGYLQTISQTDTVTLDIHGEISRNRSELNVRRRLQVITHNSKFRFVLNQQNEPCYITLSCSSKGSMNMGKFIHSPVFSQYFVRPNDSIYVQFNNYTNSLLFSGQGSTKIQCWYEIERLGVIKGMELQKESKFIESPKDLIKGLSNRDSVLKYKIGLLESYRRMLTNKDYLIFKADLIASVMEATYRDLSWGKFMTWDKRFKDSILNYYGETYKKQKTDTSALILNPLSGYYSTFLYFKTLADQNYLELSNPESAVSYSGNLLPLFTSHFAGELLDKVLMVYMYTKISKQKINNGDFDALLSIVKTPRYSDSISKMKEQLGIGSVASDFSFNDANNRIVHLSDYKGKVVLLDLWFTGCLGCLTVAKALPKVEEAFLENDVVFISLSIDKDKAKWLNSISNIKSANSNDSYKYYTGTATKYLYTGGKGSSDPFITKYNPTNTYPRLLIIDKSGKLYSADPPRPDVKGGHAELVALIKKATKN